MLKNVRSTATVKQICPYTYQQFGDVFSMRQISNREPQNLQFCEHLVQELAKSCSDVYSAVFEKFSTWISHHFVRDRLHFSPGSDYSILQVQKQTLLLYHFQQGSRIKIGALLWHLRE